MEAARERHGVRRDVRRSGRGGLRLLKEHDEIRMKWREQVERGWLQAQAGQVVDGEEVFRRADQRIKQRGRKRA